MNTIEFDQELSTFFLTKGTEKIPYRYYPNSTDVWSDLKDDDFIVEVLNNPFLNREIDRFCVKFNDSQETGGFIFPIALLESEEALLESEEQQSTRLLSYMLVSFRSLLLSIKENHTGILSDSYKDAFILVVHKNTTPDFTLEEYLIPLAKYGFYKYQGAVEEKIKNIQIINEGKKNLRLKKTNSTNFSIGYVNELVTKRLCTTHDILTRFVLDYQIIELYISEIHRKLLDETVNKYKCKNITKNDFSEKLKEISRESYQVRDLVKKIENEKECNDYKSEVEKLFNDVNYNPKNKGLDNLIYSLRNQIFHNYGMFIGYEEALAKTIFEFEKLILLLLSKEDILNP